MCAREISRPKYEIVGKLERFNEIDNPQARGEILPDSGLWKEYYQKYPELEELGKAWAKLPGPGGIGPIADRLVVAAMQGTLGLISKDEDLDGPPSPQKTNLPPVRASEKIKGLADHLGADLVRIGPLNPAWVYSQVGRAHYPGKQIGPEINLPHNTVVVVATHLRLTHLRSAPELSSLIEIVHNYLQLAKIVVTLAKYIRLLGYSARAHDLLNYQILLTPAAIDAGLGELGRNGVLINEKYGSALKIAAVTTDLPLALDGPVDLGVDEYCRQCQICAKYCPVGAIPLTQDKRIVRGVRKWKINENACYTYWRTIGTDCGICLSVCPWSRPRTFPHNLIQNAVERARLARKVAIGLDKRILRRRAKSPSWLDEQPQEWVKGLRPGHPFKN